MVRQRLRILDADVTLTAPRTVLAPIAHAYRRFLDGPAEELPDGDAVEYAAVDERTVDPVPGIDSSARLYQVFLGTLLDRLGSHALLHAAALSIPGSGVLLLAAPSGHGKSSLTLELVRRGYGFLGDDYAPLELHGAWVHPYPRAVGVTPGGAAILGEPFRSAALDPARPSLLGKALVDVGELLGEERIVRERARLRSVVLLAASLEPRAPLDTSVRLASRPADAPEVEARLADAPGVTVECRDERAGLRHWVVRADHRGAPTAALSRVIESDLVLFAEKTWDRRPDFAAEPAAIRVGRREATEMLGRELLNRRGGGRLLARHGGSVTALFFHLAGALREAACWRVRVGDRERTAALIEGLVRERPADGAPGGGG